MDWPGCSFYQELMQAYPDAKVLLSVRDPEKWYESVRSTIYPASRRAPGSLKAMMRFLVMWVFLPRIRRARRMIDTIIWQGTFDGRFEDKAHALAVFNQHNEEVKQRVSPEKLLVYDVKEGWEPLCIFLGVEVPQDKPFSHLNDRDSFLQQRDQRRMPGRR